MTNLSKTGIYRIVNIVTEEFYVGSAAKSFESRFYEHRRKLRYGTHYNKHLQASWNKHGEESFYFEILKYCRPKNCLKREQYYIDTLKPQYNKCPTAGSNFGKKLSEEHKEKLSIAHKGKPGTWLGKKLSKEHIQNSIDGRKWYKPTEETKKKTSETLKKYIKDNNVDMATRAQHKVYCKTINKEFDSILSASKFLNLNYCHLSHCIKNNKSVSGYEFEYR